MPGHVLVVSVRGRVSVQEASGAGSVELGVPLTQDTVFKIGSVTKPMVAVALLRLAQAGRLSIDDPLSRFLPAFPQARRITLRQLMAHTSGVSDAWELAPETVVSTADLVRHIAGQPLDFEPGHEWRYSNSGYMLLGAVIEAVTRKPWCDAVGELVFVPARMQHTGCHADNAVIPAAAAGYTRDATGTLRKAAPISMTGPGAAGALYSTAGDVERFMRALASGRLLPRDALAAMTTEQSLPGGKTTGYGLGLARGTVHGLPAWEHNGGIDGFASHLAWLPRQQVIAVALANIDDGSVLPRSLAHLRAAAAAGAPYRTFEPARCPEQCAGLARLAGRYGQGDSIRDIVVDTDGIHSQRAGGPLRRLVYMQGDVLAFAGDGIDWFGIERDASGDVVALVLHADGADEGVREVRLR
jgi:CubicO group peptidase (beta-lactamase class C family)